MTMTNRSKPEKNEEKNSELLTIQFGTVAHEVNAEAVASMIRAVTRLIQSASKEIGLDCELSVKVRAFAPGSLQIPLELIIPTGAYLFEKAPILASHLAILKDYLSLKKWLQGKPLPEKNKDGQYVIGDQKIEIHRGTANVFNNCQINNYFNEAMCETRKDSAVKDVAFFRGEEKEPLEIIPETHFQHFDVSAHEDVTVDHSEQTERISVTVAATDFLGKRKWKVVYLKNIIPVSITDEEFIQKVASSEYRFGAGDKLDVDMNIKYKWDKNTDEFLIDRSGYVITKVWRHIQKRAKRKSKKQSKGKKQRQDLFD
jgi:hypothetical protein